MIINSFFGFRCFVVFDTHSKSNIIPPLVLAPKSRIYSFHRQLVIGIFNFNPPLIIIILVLLFLPLSSFRRHCQVTFESFHLKKDWRRFFFWRRCLLLTLPQALTFECFYCSLPNIFPFLCVLKVFIWKLLDNKAGLTRGHKSLPQKPRKAKKENVTKA